MSPTRPPVSHPRFRSRADFRAPTRPEGLLSRGLLQEGVVSTFTRTVLSSRTSRQMTRKESHMRQAFLAVCCAVTAVLLLPVAARAQSSMAGVVKDASGAVLPGVTVEAASPALIEKTRSAVTDGTGQYRIEDLRPGTYSVTFTLAGFSTVKRENIELAGSQTVTIPIE